jgi:hypothetical protein
MELDCLFDLIWNKDFRYFSLLLISIIACITETINDAIVYGQV